MILVFGQTGQVARALQRQAAALPATQGPLLALGREGADLSDPAACAAAIATHRPAAVINAAAWTAVDRAEAEEAAAHVVNAEAPGAMARACAALGIPLVHISTDYVFDGTGTAPFSPGAPTAPLGAYGRSKLAGEAAVRAAGGAHAILRTSWVFSAQGTNFVTTMLRLGASRDRLGVVGDQTGGPTPAAAIAAACLAIARQIGSDPAKSGTYHFAGAPDVTWADFARAIMARAGLPCVIDDIPTSAWPTPARRPANSRLDCSTTAATFGLPRPDWRQGLDAVLKELETT